MTPYLLGVAFVILTAFGIWMQEWRHKRRLRKMREAADLLHQMRTPHYYASEHRHLTQWWSQGKRVKR